MFEIISEAVLKFYAGFPMEMIYLVNLYRSVLALQETNTCIMSILSLVDLLTEQIKIAAISDQTALLSISSPFVFGYETIFDCTQTDWIKVQGLTCL